MYWKNISKQNSLFTLWLEIVFCGSLIPNNLTYHISIIYRNIHLPTYDKNLQLLPNNGKDLGPGSSEYSLTKSTSPCNTLVKTSVDLLARSIFIRKFHNRLAKTDILLFLLLNVYVTYKQIIRCNMYTLVRCGCLCSALIIFYLS